ncbi:MAG: sulfite exporter TauE/SafE family protein [Gammaproteobacteria bacterium]|nr:sulfite exporter TauE/SafE family protein [Gammaproteobacteria bacterium]
MTEPLPVYAALALAVLVTGISKSGIGGGAGGLAVPLLAMVMAPARGAAIMLPILCLMDLFSVRAYWLRWDIGNIAVLVPAAIVGIGIGTLAFGVLDPDRLRLLIGGIAIAFCLDGWLRRAGRAGGSRRPGRISGLLWGAVSGFTSFVAHAGGPPLSIHLLPQRLDRGVFVATSALFFLIVNAVKLAPYAWLGLFDAANLTTSIALAPIAPIGIWLGLALHRRVDERLFYRLVHVLLFTSGVKLVWDGAAGML